MQLRIPLSEVGFPIRKSADQSFFAAPRGLSQRSTSFIASQRQGIHQMLFSHLIALIINAHSTPPLLRSSAKKPSHRKRAVPATNALSEDRMSAPAIIDVSLHKPCETHTAAHANGLDSHVRSLEKPVCFKIEPMSHTRLREMDQQGHGRGADRPGCPEVSLPRYVWRVARIALRTVQHELLALRSPGTISSSRCQKTRAPMVLKTHRRRNFFLCGRA